MAENDNIKILFTQDELERIKESATECVIGEMLKINTPKDTIEFKLAGHRYGSSVFPVGTVEIYINNENFRQKIRDLELPFAEAEGSPMIAGHSAIKPIELYNSLHDAYLDAESVPIFGNIDCWPLKVSIDINDDVVIWNGFNMNQREEWDYSELVRFIFDKNQYFQEIDKLLLLEKQSQDIVEKFKVGFDIHDYGWATMHMCLDGKRCITRLSYLFSPFDDFLNMLKKIDNGSSLEEITINEEGLFTFIKICAEPSDDMLSISVIQENAYDIPKNHFSCKVLRSNFIQVFKWAFQMLEDEEFDPTCWGKNQLNDKTCINTENDKMYFMPDKHKDDSQYDRWVDYALEAALCYDDEKQREAFFQETYKIGEGRFKKENI